MRDDDDDEEEEEEEEEDDDRETGLTKTLLPVCFH